MLLSPELREAESWAVRAASLTTGMRDSAGEALGKTVGEEWRLMEV